MNNRLRRWCGRFMRRRLVRALVRESLIEFVDKYAPYQPLPDSYVVSKPARQSDEGPDKGLPIPPSSRLFEDSVEQWLLHGQQDTETMRSALAAAGHSFRKGDRILDWGCRNGRMLRWLLDLSDCCEIWGADISATDIVWCEQNLSPPFHFVTTSSSPHLPFEDRSFKLIFAGSVFTHIDDLATAWFLELRRILEPGGMLYFTIHDKHTIDLFRGPAWRTTYRRSRCHWPLGQRLLHDKHTSALAQSDFARFTIRHGVDLQVFRDVDHLCKTLESWWRIVSVQEEAFAWQTGILMERQ